jgi:tRNA threonylcarbamoyl adenosine modification protein YjeE
MPVVERRLPDERATIRLGEDIAAALRPGDVIALQGDLGAGKTTLARGVIRALATDPGLEVPSPTFTLVQSYETRIPLQHFDLYRLSSPDELDELGLDEAAATGAVLIEWPEKAGDRLPGDLATLRLADHGEGRTARFEGPQEFLSRIERSLAIRDFLERSGWGEAVRTHLTGDASARSYETVALAGEPERILMNSPRLVLGPAVRDGKPYAEIAHTAQSVQSFVGVAKLLREGGVSVPEIFAQDLEQGLLLIEHLGSGGFLSPAGEPVQERYEAAGQLLAFMHERHWPDRAEVEPGLVHVVPPFDRDAMLIEVELVLDWYIPAFKGRPALAAEREAFVGAWNEVLDRLDGMETTLMLRDVQSPNFIWRADRQGRDRLGVIDFQDALIGPSAYDVASLALDPRVTISPEIERATVEAYVSARGPGFDRAAFDEAYAIMGAQRHSKILGLFVRLDRRDGKPIYLKHLPRIRNYLRRTFAHPALREVREMYAKAGLLDGTPE